MDWQEIERITRLRITPELDEWAVEVGSRPAPAATPTDPPTWMIEAMIKTVDFSQRTIMGPIGHTMHLSSWRTPTYGAMSVVLGVKHGIFGGPSGQREFMLALESRLRAYGPLDSLDGTGPGKAQSVFLDELGRLHNPNGPALTFKGTLSLHALRGVHIPQDAWSMRDDAKAVLAWVTNAEVRRSLIERMGVKEFITQAGLRPTHRDRFGTFYRLDRGSNGYVQVVCPSTHQEYFLAVPGHCRSAHEAVAWTFRMVPEDYDPAKEA